MEKYKKVASDIDYVIKQIVSRGKIREAYSLYKVAQVIEALDKFPPDIVQLAKDIGVILTPENIAEIITKYSNPSIPMDMNKEAFDMKSRTKSLALLAAMLVNTFISSVEAKGKPITVNTNFGPKTYTAQELKQLKKTDPKSFSIILKLYMEQQDSRMDVENKKELHEQVMKGKPLPGKEMKAVKEREDLEDDFGNKARLITYEDGTKKLEGDILHGGVSLRKKLLERGEIQP
jgi:hypothetical protein